MKRQVADRLFMTSISMTLVATAFIVPQSLIYSLVQQGGLPALLCMLFLAAASFVALLDTVVNDMLPPRYAFKTGLGRRRGLWMAVAITYAGISFVIVKAGYGLLPAIFFLLYAVRCAVMAFLDLYYEYRPVIDDPSTPINGTIPGALGDD